MSGWKLPVAGQVSWLAVVWLWQLTGELEHLEPLSGVDFCLHHTLRPLHRTQLQQGTSGGAGWRCFRVEDF